ncbi:MAG: hypothetical protein ACJ71U_18280 [Terriglobales bacterium]
MPDIAFSGRRKRYDTMPEYVQDQTKPTNEDQQQEQHPSQPLEIQPDGTWILGKGANRWMPTKYQIGDMRWLVERDLRNELGVPPKYARDAEKIEFHKRQLALLDLAKQAPRCEHVFTDGRCCKAPRVKKGKLCYAHTLMEEKRPLELNLPPLEDANAVMLWLMDTLRGLAEGRITEKSAGLMFYGLQLAMVNARFTTFRDTNHAEMVTKAPRDRRNRAESPKSEGRALPQRAQRNTEEEAAGDFTAKGAEVAKKKNQRELATVTPTSEERALPQRAQRNTEEEATPSFTAKDAEVAEKKGQAGSATAMPKSEERALPQSTHRNTDEEATPSFTAKDANNEEPAGAGRDFTAENAEVGEVKVAEEEDQEQGTGLRIEDRLKGQNPEGIPGVESAKSIFFGVELGEGVADNRPVSPPSEPPRKSSQSEVLVVPKDVEHHAGR